ncbi:hypothetical protein [Flammeovirga agarivorans]|uniref:YD repeat-containing protein n=1 Tax=Flammeovirga agarivorans TaxID=2726742 RepID=A0A7X8XVL1_9BACT|nr:hypothetical protein [Flammeovirga agarivorans]NLR91396.1 hypothetical protein [Flammeovirga agarivorans]
MKYFLKLIFLFLNIWNCSAQTKTVNKNIKLISLTYIHADTTKADNDQIVTYDYDEKQRIKSYTIKSEAFESTEHFFYEDGKISKIIWENSNAKWNSESILKYNSEGQLIELTKYNTGKSYSGDTQKNVFQLKGFCITYLKHEKNKITSTLVSNYEVDNKIPDQVKVIHLDSNKNCTVTEYVSGFNNYQPPKCTYDNHYNPSNLIYPKYLLGYIEFRQGNKLTEGDNISYEYKYNHLGYPTEVKKFVSGKLKTTSFYTYSK